MKSLIYLLTIGFLLITSCTGVKTVTKGLESESFIELIDSQGKYRNGVDVTIDETITFKAKVNKANVKRPKGNVYAISTGKHIVTVKYNNAIIYSKQIFVSAQETKQIELR